LERQDSHLLSIAADEHLTIATNPDGGANAEEMALNSQTLYHLRITSGPKKELSPSPPYWRVTDALSARLQPHFEQPAVVLPTTG
jgi:hypothetical protein